MSRGVNKVILVGHVGQDPKINETGGGFHVANFSIATSEMWKDKQTGEKVEKTEWHNVTAFGKLADIVRQFVTKGTLIYVEGKLNTTKYQDKATGQDKYSTKVLIDQLTLLGSKGDASQAQSATQSAPSTESFIDDSDVPF